MSSALLLITILGILFIWGGLAGCIFWAGAKSKSRA